MPSKVIDIDDWLVRYRNLPHVDAAGKPYFITSCLEGSICQRGLRAIQDYRRSLDHQSRPKDYSERDWEYHKQKLLFKFIDNWLDHHSINCALAQPAIADLLVQSFWKFHRIRYYLYAYCVMPSHCHWLFLPILDPPQATRLYLQRTPHGNLYRESPYTSRQWIVQSINSYTAKFANRLLGQNGKFWQTESYDHVVPDEEELVRIVAYIENNPVKANLVSSPEQWRWSSAFHRFQFPSPIGEPLV